YETTSSRGPLVHPWSAKSAVPFFWVGKYAPVSDELTAFDLPVEGAIPRAGVVVAGDHRYLAALVLHPLKI
ncbi:MAG TPA: hypothetical protein VEZ90_00750, partial [Blastocatellia bacterium]|nr:hypothetical protein [Blastocatellia bacterium]